MLPDREKEINGHLYKIVLFDADTGLGMWSRLMEIMLAGGGGLLDGDIGGAADKLVALLQMGKLNVSRLVQDLLVKLVSIDGEKPAGDKAFALWFAGNYGTLIEVVRFVIEENFRDFFVVLAPYKDVLKTSLMSRVMAPELNHMTDRMSEVLNKLAEIQAQIVMLPNEKAADETSPTI
jgi:hypothetical protein